MLFLKDILRSTHGRVCGKINAPYFSGISTDTRSVKKNDLFIPLVGKKYDGHKFLNIAFKKGASAALSSKKMITDKPLIYIKDTLRAFHEIAHMYKASFKTAFVGITGSSGKTTTKDMLASILSLSGKTLKTEGNLNNEIGVPQTLLTLNKHHRFAVIEMAMQGLGEIEELADIVRPNVVVITNIGTSHMKFLRTRSNVAKAKSEILKFQNKNDIAVLPADDQFFDRLKRKAKGKVISFGLKNNADVTAENVLMVGNMSYFDIRYKDQRTRINLPLPGEHNIYDALASAAAAFSLKIPLKTIRKGLENIKLSGKRSNIIKRPSFTIIDDTYNANPESMTASLKMLSHYPGRRIAVLGDMLELGRITKKSHEDIGKLAASLKLNALITVGKYGGMIARTARKQGLLASVNAGTNQKALKLLKKIIRKNDTVLIKGSRGMHMEAITEGLSL